MMVLPAAWFGWRAYSYAGIVAGCVVGIGLLSLAIPIMRTCLIVTDECLIDRRVIRAIRIPWQQITGFEIARPGWLWGGFCIKVARLDGTSLDLLSTRVHSRTPTASHIDDLHRISWTLEEYLSRHRGNSAVDP
jgi:hypothetical protein